MANAVYGIITDRIIKLLEAGTIPWRSPWSAGSPANIVSRKAYRGINPFMLACSGFSSPYWMTFKQAQNLGGTVRKGERSTPVVFYKTWTFGTTDADTGERGAKTVPILRYYNVFNLSQCDGIADPDAGADRPIIAPIDRCAAVVDGMPNPPRIEHGEPRAYYRPSSDLVNMPTLQLFTSAEAYHATLFHELGHATGHKSRLDREGVTGGAGFKSAEYSREELIAEMTAAFLCGHCGIDAATIDNAASYIAGWMRKLRDDATLIVRAASAAQKAADYILGATPALVEPEAAAVDPIGAPSGLFAAAA